MEGTTQEAVICAILEAAIHWEAGEGYYILVPTDETDTGRPCFTPILLLTGHPEMSPGH